MGGQQTNIQVTINSILLLLAFAALPVVGDEPHKSLNQVHNWGIESPAESDSVVIKNGRDRQENYDQLDLHSREPFDWVVGFYKSASLAAVTGQPFGKPIAGYAIRAPAIISTPTD